MEGIEPNGTISSAMKYIINATVLALILSWSALAFYKQDHWLVDQQKTDLAGTLTTTVALRMYTSQDGVEGPLQHWILLSPVAYAVTS